MTKILADFGGFLAILAIGDFFWSPILLAQLYIKQNIAYWGGFLVHFLLQLPKKK